MLAVVRDTAAADAWRSLLRIDIATGDALDRWPIDRPTTTAGLLEEEPHLTQSGALAFRTASVPDGAPAGAGLRLVEDRPHGGTLRGEDGLAIGPPPPPDGIGWLVDLAWKPQPLTEVSASGRYVAAVENRQRVLLFTPTSPGRTLAWDSACPRTRQGAGGGLVGSNRRLQCGSFHPMSVSLHQSGSLIAALSDDGRIRAWDMAGRSGYERYAP